MNELKAKLIQQVVEALQAATPNQIYLILDTIGCITAKENGKE